MGKRHLSDTYEWEPLKKKPMLHDGIKKGDVLQDISGRQWKLGREVGQGAFGEIYTASDNTTREVEEHSPYVAKLELHSNGPLFVEVNFYLRVAKKEMINEWTLRNRKIVGLPHYITSGSHTKKSTKYRFLILPRYSIDLHQVLERHGNKCNIKTVLIIGLQLLDTLEYIHSHGFIHADIKASNILLNEEETVKGSSKQTDESVEMYRTGSMKRIRNCKLNNATVIRRNLRSNKNLCIVPYEQRAAEQSQPREPEDCTKNTRKDLNQVYLLDFGLACKYLQSNGEHKKFCVDERKAHAGTILFCSLDAHDGVYSRRSDLESLGYNMIYWLTGSLPWMHNVEDYEVVKKKKEMCMQQLDNFLRFCFGKNIPSFLKNYFQHVNKLKYDQTPDYEHCRKVLLQGFNEYGYKKVFTLDFENKEGWGLKQKRTKNRENDRRRTTVVCSIMRTPLKSNLPAKHALRKNKLKDRMLRWSNILIDPELILKSAKKPKEKEHDYTDGNDGMANLNIYDLNPTQAMLNVYNNYFDRHNYNMVSSPRHKGDCNCPFIDGYNAAMMTIYNKMVEQREREIAEMVSKIPKRRGRKPLHKRVITSHTKRGKKKSPKRYNTRTKKNAE